MPGHKDHIKGVVLAGGLGKRLDPLTNITNKHLLPVYNKPMVYYSVRTLVEAGIDDIMIVTGGNNAGDFLKLLGNGKEFGLKHIQYSYQKGEGGIADALRLAWHFAAGNKIVAILGDNLVEKSIAPYVESFRSQDKGAKILLKEINEPQRFGVAELRNNKIVSIEEKPKFPRSNYAVTGIYMYDCQVFDVIKTLKPSARGELEITDVNNAYLAKNELTFDILDGWWSDCGTFDSLLRAGNLIAEKNKVNANSEVPRTKIRGFLLKQKK